MNVDQLPKRFLDKVDFSGECWLWTALKDRDGYGRFNVLGREVRSHRFMWEHINGEIPEGLFICHECDTPACVNPGHLFKGTNLDNIADRTSKGRSASGDRHGSHLHPETIANGERNGNSKLTQFDVDEIRKSYQRGVRGNFSLSGLAKKYNVTKPLISCVVNNRIWINKKVSSF